ncbi:response regulator transcription factor [Nesterenkonia sp. DZ6]|uniref:response regulator transcription factor n=1 Tax=Nesterenkonia sp. DZ6 TaxID=2901229 RepID=UPI001F4CCC1C|nr:response regulator transcription factor [Nesterenkonia sp. DZ6]MCH8560409.1 response regulator transcription factor [Nesterenkonia sp. DZ6]
MLRLVVADDHPIMRAALRAYVDSAPDMVCVGEAQNGLEVIERVREEKPDVVIMDLKMPVMGGVEATAAVMAIAPETSVLAVTTFSSEGHALQALNAGAKGYIVKDATADQVLEAIRQVHGSSVPISPDVARKLEFNEVNEAEEFSLALAGSDYLPRTPPRETEVLSLLARGFSNREIATRMVLTEGAVKAHLGRLCVRFGVRDRVQLLIRATQLGLIEPQLEDGREE